VKCLSVLLQKKCFLIFQIKAAFTRTYNKGSHLTPYASDVAAKKKSKKTGVETEGLGTGETPDVTDDDSADDTGESFRVKKGGKTGRAKSGKQPATADSKQARGKGTGKGKSKNKK
jgi:replication factor C subunit 1